MSESYMAGEIYAKDLSYMTGERYDDSCAFNVSHSGRKVWSSYYAFLVSTVHLMCNVIKHSINPKRIEVRDEPKDKIDMQV